MFHRTICFPRVENTPACPVPALKWIVHSFVLLLLLFFLPTQRSFAQAPDIVWQKTFGGSTSDESECIRQTSDGGYIIAGWTYSGDIDVTGNHSPGNADCWIIKTDPVGNVEWKKNIGGSDFEDALVIQQTKDGGYILAGHTSSSDGDLSANYSNSYDALVVKLDQSGNIQWIKNLGGPGYDVAISIEETQDGGYVFAGYTESNSMDVSGNHGDYDGWIVKLSSSGVIQWQRCIGGTNRDVAWSVKPTPDGGYVFTGYTMSVNGDIASNHGKYDIMAGKLGAAGEIQWVKTYGGTADEVAAEIIVTSDGGYVIAGHSFSANGDVSANFGQNDVWIIKLTSLGNIQWQRSFGGGDYEDPYSIQQTVDGGYVIGGRTRSVNGDVTFNNGDNDYWVLRLDGTGTLLWQKTLGGTKQDIGHSVRECADGGLIVAGTSYSADGDVTKNVGGSDIWIVKLGECTSNTPAVPGNIAGSLSPCEGAPVSYSISPVTDATGYYWTFPTGWIIVAGQGSVQVSVIPNNIPGDIGVSAYNSCKSSGKKITTVTPVVTPAPQITISTDVVNEICKGTPVVFTAKATGAALPVYEWKKNGVVVGNNSDTYSDSGLENNDVILCSLTSTTACATQVVLSPAITMIVLPVITPAIVISGNATPVCKGEEIRFTAVVTGGGANPTLTWYVNNTSTGQHLPDFITNSLSNGDIVSCQLVSDARCATPSAVLSNTITASVATAAQPSVAITTAKTVVCKNDAVSFTAAAVNAGDSPLYTWWVNGVPAGQNSAVFISSTLSDKDEVVCALTPAANSCAVNTVFSNKLIITINPLPQLVIHPADTVVSPGSQVRFDTYASEDLRSFQWTPAAKLVDAGLFEPVTTPVLEAVTYRFSAVTKNGCPIFKDVIVKPLYPLYIPNAFTPNGDGKNDVFRIPQNTDIRLTAFSVYNRWGEKIFTTKDVNKGWDGRVNGVAQSSDVYIYEISGFQGDKPVFFKGSFSLIR